MFLGFLKLKVVRENRERRRPVKEEYGLIFDGSPTVCDKGKLDKYKESVMYICDCDYDRDLTWLLGLDWMYAEF